MCYHGGVLSHFSWTDAGVSIIELSLWKMMSSIIFVTRTSSEWQVIGIDWKNTDIVREADPRRGLICQSFCYWFLPFCILFGITSHPWMKHVFPLSFCCFEIKRCLFQRVFLTKYFDQTPTCKIKASQSLKIKSILITEMTWCLKMTWGDQTILNSYLLKLNHPSCNYF